MTNQKPYLERVWSDNEAKYIYQLYSSKPYKFTSTLGTHLVPNTFMAEGNLAWAKRIAKHYGIEVPKE